MKILLICGSPRKGNTEFILSKIYKALTDSKELILLREKKINHCTGCLYCDEHKKCAVQDDMQAIYPKIVAADLIILGTPNYFDNVPGIMKDFIDRTNSLYETGKLKGKKIITIVVGGGSVKNSKKVGTVLKSFYNAHQLKSAGEYYFQGLKNKDVEKDAKAKVMIDKILKIIGKLSN